MRVSKVCNFSLLKTIAQKGETTYTELKGIYCKPTPRGVILAKNVMFDSDLELLASEGYIQITDDVIKFIRF